MLKDLYAALDGLFGEMVAWRRHLHRHPELSFHEEATPAFVAETLRSFGVSVRTGVGGRGVVGRIEGGRPGRTVALRADFDALPIQDEKTVSYRSTVPGVMHACGHDGHTATLLAVAKVLAARRADLPGTVVLIHQFAEEVAPGGARPMIEDGALDGVDVIFGTHLWAGLPVGVIGYRAGYAMANADAFTIEIAGRGGHGAAPHQTIDSLLIGANLVVKLQQIVARRVDPLKEAVVTVGTFHAGTAFNVIAERAVLTGTVRTFDEAVRAQVEAEIRRLAEAEAAAFGARAEVRYERGYDAVHNDPAVTVRFAEAMRAVYDPARVVEVPPSMGGEDFAYYLQKVPGTFFFTGAGNAGVGAEYPHHHPRFDIDERAMLIAAKALVTAAVDALDETGAAVAAARGALRPVDALKHVQV
ncbi:amidohydrolase [Hydrogenibacillus sp. N12]|uniref:amidohydrolase n=1 Tax=Hydrogenibacillus sp. N12 TaxID=2866627 RepID=UPI001C7DDEBE|nr:amidohydrolase [Hydrogenibacillus sp. N12]QZA32214.1 amidohydrolase [Hydrogenibacillus sp. N12]